MSKGSGLAVIALLLGVSGLGLGGYAFYQIQTIELLQGEQGEQGEQGIAGTNGTDLIGLWNEPSGSGNDFNLSFSEVNYTRSEFFTISADNESLQFTKAGWYKINLHLLFSGIVSSDRYKIELLKNGVNTQFLLFFDVHPSSYYYVATQGFFWSDVNDVFTLRCYSDFGDDFDIYPNTEWNQIALEYVYNTI